MHDSNKPAGLVSPLRRQICLNPVWLDGLRSSASLRSPSDRSGSGPHSPHAKLASDQFDDSTADQTGWLDWVMNCDGDHHDHSSVVKEKKKNGMTDFL